MKKITESESQKLKMFLRTLSIISEENYPPPDVWPRTCKEYSINKIWNPDGSRSIALFFDNEGVLLPDGSHCQALYFSSKDGNHHSFSNHLQHTKN
jgi:hypothetical protein